MPSEPRTQRPSAAPTRRSVVSGTDPDFDAILALAHSVNKLHRQVVATCAPMVQNILRSRTQDHRQIEHLLDRLLDWAGIPDGLSLFRTLCRYYFPINPAATASYIHAYREMWDSDDTEEAKA